jgi:starch phosphorylase
MAHMGLRLGQRANGVSRLHGEVSREMFAPLWPGFDAAEVPIGSITNGVHAPTWAAREWFEQAREFIGTDLVEEARGWERPRAMPLAALWATRNALRAKLVDEVRRRVRASWRERGAADAELAWTDSVFDPDALTVGFARRVPTYKRLTLMLRDPGRLRALLLDEERPMQMVVAGKSHPADDGGKSLIQQVVRFADDPAVRHRIVFLPNYDMSMARFLYWGCDVWLNNPLRPLEACGTSGMKSALNGGLNLSIRDGWWDEMYDGENGWAIPTADGVTDEHRRDDLEAGALYDLMGASVLPRFYDRDADGLPVRWAEMVRHTLQTLGPKVPASRMVHDYATGYYAPAAESSRKALSDNFAGAREVAAYRRRVERAWAGVKVLQVDSAGLPDTPEIGAVVTLRANVDLGELTPSDVVVQAVFGRVAADDELSETTVVPMNHLGHATGADVFAVDTPLPLSGAVGYTVRVLPHHELLASDAELGLVGMP